MQKGAPQDLRQAVSLEAGLYESSARCGAESFRQRKAGRGVVTRAHCGVSAPTGESRLHQSRVQVRLLKVSRAASVLEKTSRERRSKAPTGENSQRWEEVYRRSATAPWFGALRGRLHRLLAQHILALGGGRPLEQKDKSEEASKQKTQDGVACVCGYAAGSEGENTHIRQRCVECEC